MPPQRFVSEEEVEKWRASREEARWQDVWERIGIPYEYKDASLSKGENTHAMQAVREYMATDYSSGRCGWLMGNTGVGKSFAVAAGLREAGRTNNHLVGRRFYDFTVLCTQLIQPGRDDVFAEAMETWFIVLDDFGRDEEGIAYVKKGGAAEAKIEAIFRTREAARRPTLCTTNMSSADLAVSISERLRSRLEGDWGVTYNCYGQDLRRRG
jgi:DNA replication protein DnaC